jgi:CHAT domain-containing protein
VAEPQAAGLAALPFAETDVDVASFFISQADRLAGAAATREAVLAALRGKSACHFACHAYARPASPMDSALVLADGPLELRDLISTEDDKDLLRSRLMVLDACETYVPGTELPDEAISLATGFLQLGAAGVIATRWAVGGLAASLLKARFYREWRLSAMSPAQALSSAQRWLRDTTNAEKAEWLRPGDTTAELPRTVTRLLWREIIRRPPDAVEFAHQADWAAYTHTGT